jgi:hypothetical protein
MLKIQIPELDKDSVKIKANPVGFQSDPFEQLRKNRIQANIHRIREGKRN